MFVGLVIISSCPTKYPTKYQAEKVACLLELSRSGKEFIVIFGTIVNERILRFLSFGQPLVCNAEIVCGLLVVKKIFFKRNKYYIFHYHLMIIY